MLKELLYPLVNVFTPFNVFQYITFRAAYAAITSLLVTFIFGPKLIRLLRRIKAGESIREDGPTMHHAKSGTPTMGGTLIIASSVFSILLWQDFGNLYTWVALIAFVLFGAIGFVDDYLKIIRKNSDGLAAWIKLVVQSIVALACIGALMIFEQDFTTNFYLPFFKGPLIDLHAFYVFFAVLLIVGYSNAVNLADGLDGLATGLVIFVGIAMAVFSYISGRVDFAEYLQIPYFPGSGELAIVCLSVVGSCIGFLWYNSHPADIMMGDTGSLALGGILGVIAVMLKKEILFLIVGGVFVIEVLSVIIQVVSYRLTKRRVFKMAPIHHHFELIGWNESRIVLRLWILGGLFAFLGLSMLKVQ
jgi:phospho-N-acetylmuramoyl-pentapeptide-transferase